MSAFRSEMERQAWNTVKARKAFHWNDLEAAGYNRATAQDFVRRWEQAGLIRMIRKDQHRKIYANAKHADQPSVEEIQAKDAVQAMWTLMRRLRTFSPKDLVAHVNATQHELTQKDAEAYCRALAEASYLRVLQSPVRGGQDRFYALVENSGPTAPRRTRRWGIDDPNTEEFKPSQRRGNR